MGYSPWPRVSRTGPRCPNLVVHPVREPCAALSAAAVPTREGDDDGRRRKAHTQTFCSAPEHDRAAVS